MNDVTLIYLMFKVLLMCVWRCIFYSVGGVTLEGICKAEELYRWTCPVVVGR